MDVACLRCSSSRCELAEEGVVGRIDLGERIAVIDVVAKAASVPLSASHAMAPMTSASMGWPLLAVSVRLAQSDEGWRNVRAV